MGVMPFFIYLLTGKITGAILGLLLDIKRYP
jgi:hypothetical protein